MLDPAAYAAEARSRIAEADKRAFASGLAFARGPEAFLAHIEKTMDADLEEIYRELGYEEPSAAEQPAASGTDSATGSDPGDTPQPGSS